MTEACLSEKLDSGDSQENEAFFQCHPLLCCCLSPHCASPSLSWAAAVTELSYVNTLVTQCGLCGGELHVPVFSVIVN